ncbi:TetR/AcrR family transcriptional regulator [Mycoplasmatota bacterium WC44]
MKKQLIIKSYMELVKETGSMRDISIQQIANKAGIGKGTVYEYFSSKEEIVMSLVEHMVDKTSSMFLNDTGYEGLNYEDSLKRFIQNVYEGAISVNRFSKYNQHNIHEVVKFADMKEILFKKLKDFHIKNIEIFRRNVYSKGVDEGIVDDTLDDIDILIILKTLIREFSESVEFKIIDINVINKKLYRNTFKLLKKAGN